MKTKNEFIAPTDPNLEEEKYLSTNLYNRKGDFMSRITYNVDLIENKLIRPDGLTRKLVAGLEYTYSF